MPRERSPRGSRRRGRPAARKTVGAPRRSKRAAPASAPSPGGERMWARHRRTQPASPHTLHQSHPNDTSTIAANGKHLDITRARGRTQTPQTRARTGSGFQLSQSRTRGFRPAATICWRTILSGAPNCRRWKYSPAATVARQATGDSCTNARARQARLAPETHQSNRAPRAHAHTIHGVVLERPVRARVHHVQLRLVKQVTRWHAADLGGNRRGHAAGTRGRISQ